MDRQIEFGMWLGVAMLALIGAKICLWRTSRVLIRLRSERDVSKARLLPTALARMAGSDKAS